MPEHRRVLLIRRSWARAAQDPQLAGDLFYGRLFTIAPEVRRLFPKDHAEQSRKLVATLGWIVDHLDAPEIVTPAAADLAIRHTGYGVRAEDYAPVGAALLWMLDHLLGPAFDEETHAAWAAAYDALSAAMIEAAEGPASTAGVDR